MFIFVFILNIYFVSYGLQLIVLSLLKPRSAESDYYRSLTSVEAPLFPGLGDEPDNILEDDTAEEFERVAEKVSSIARDANIFDNAGIRILLNYIFKLYLLT